MKIINTINGKPIKVYNTIKDNSILLSVDGRFGEQVYAMNKNTYNALQRLEKGIYYNVQ